MNTTEHVRSNTRTDLLVKQLVGGRSWFNVAQLAWAWQVHPNFVRQLIHSGELRAWRVGRRFRIDPSDVEVFLERCSTVRADDTATVP